MSSIDLLLNKIKTCVGFKQINKEETLREATIPPHSPLLGSRSGATAIRPGPFYPNGGPGRWSHISKHHAYTTRS